MKLIVSSGGGRIFLKPGQGKTTTSLIAFKVLKQLGMVDALLVVAPLRVISTSWPQELEKWEELGEMTYTTIHGGREARREAMREDVDVYLMNVEGVISTEWKLDKYNRVNEVAKEWLARKGRVMLVIDESTKFKNPQASRSKTLKKYLPYFARRYVLTGTPRPGKLEDLFFQCLITDLGHDLGQFITHFRRRYMMPDESGFGYVEQRGASEIVSKIISPTTIQIEPEEVVPTQSIPVWVPMEDHVKSQYDELKREFLLELGDATVMAPNAGVLYGKLKQLCQGAIYTPTKDGYSVIHDKKLDALENILGELDGEPAFCLYSYSHDYERINKRLGYEVPRVGGGISAKKGRDYCSAFSTGDVPLLLGHPQSVAHGIDGLQNNCRNIIWFGNDPSWENTYQANLRIARPGTKADQVNIYYIMLNCATERSVLETVTGKERAESAFLGLLRNNLESE